MHFVYKCRVTNAALDILEIPYRADASQHANRLADLPGLVFLDSSVACSDSGHDWDLIAAMPETVLSAADYEHDAGRWLRAVESALQQRRYGVCSLDAPFATGAIGFLDYDTAARTHGVCRMPPMPARVGLYPAVVLQHHCRQRAWLVCEPHCPNSTRQALLERLTDNTPLSAAPKATDNTVSLDRGFQPEQTREAYLQAVAGIQHYLRAGDCYQVNYAHRFCARFTGDYWHLYGALRQVLQGGFSAYVALAPKHALLSFSPERFLAVNGEQVITQPIKGTAPRHPDPAADHAAAQTLVTSSKDRAENVMITDLLRNDLGRFCRPGSVRTRELCVLKSYRNVHHLVSTVLGSISPGVSSGRLFAGSSPGGSITGAPKRRAIEIIAELESAPRGGYCGSIFSLTVDGRLNSSITIRTIEALAETLYCWGGGGITVDSDPAAEYQETLDKIGSLMAALPVSVNG